MKIFKLDKEYEAVCQSESTRYGFRHLATLFESVLRHLIDNNAIDDKQKKIWLNAINKRRY
jgi:hypothetical protein